MPRSCDVALPSGTALGRHDAHLLIVQCIVSGYRRRMVRSVPHRGRRVERASRLVGVLAAVGVNVAARRATACRIEGAPGRRRSG
jgi:hypothetical protein